MGLGVDTLICGAISEAVHIERSSKMPGRNRTGPMGQGPMTGRGMGSCRGAETTLPPAAKNNPPLGMGRLRGGRGWRHRVHATSSAGWMRYGAGQAPLQASVTDDEEQFLLRQVELLRDQLERIKHRLDALARPDTVETH